MIAFSSSASASFSLGQPAPRQLEPRRGGVGPVRMLGAKRAGGQAQQHGGDASAPVGAVVTAVGVVEDRLGVPVGGRICVGGDHQVADERGPVVGALAGAGGVHIEQAGDAAPVGEELPLVEVPVNR